MTLNEENSVTFHDFHETYATNQDVFVSFELPENFSPTNRDWIGLYPSIWNSPSQYLAFEWVPQRPRNKKFPRLRSVIFKAHFIHVPPHASKTYKMLYVSKFETVLGASTPFRIFDEVTADNDASVKALECVEKHIDGAGAVTMVVSNVLANPNGELNSFEMVEESDVAAPQVASGGTSRCASACESPAAPATSSKTSIAALSLASVSHGKSVSFDVPFTYSSVVQKPLMKETEQRAHPVKFEIPTERSVREIMKQCRACADRKRSQVVLKQQVLASQTEAKSLQCDLQSTKVKLQEKEEVISEMSNQIKSLIHENASLTNVNNTLADSVTNLSGADTERFRLSRELEALTSQMSHMQTSKVAEQTDRELAERQAVATQRRVDSLKDDNSRLRDAVAETCAERDQLQTYINDVMYTLSLHGYSHLQAVDGTMVDITSKEGDVLKINGDVYHQRDKENHEETINSQKQHIEKLESTCGSLKRDLNSWQGAVTQKDVALCDALNQLADESNRVIALRKELSLLEKKLKQTTEREAVMSAELEELREQKLRLERDFTSMQESLGGQVSVQVRAQSACTASPPVALPKKSRSSKSGCSDPFASGKSSPRSACLDQSLRQERVKQQKSSRSGLGRIIKSPTQRSHGKLSPADVKRKRSARFVSPHATPTGASSKYSKSPTASAFSGHTSVRTKTPTKEPLFVRVAPPQALEKEEVRSACNSPTEQTNIEQEKRFIFKDSINAGLHLRPTAPLSEKCPSHSEASTSFDEDEDSEDDDEDEYDRENINSSNIFYKSSTKPKKPRRLPPSPTPPPPKHWCAKGNEGRKPKRTGVQFPYTKKKAYSVHVMDNVCTRCGIVFPPNTRSSVLEQHIKWHRVFKY